MPTHSRGNLLDLVLSTVDNLSYAVLDASFTDHKVICFQVPLHSRRTSAMVFAKSSFNTLNFNTELTQFYWFCLLIRPFTLTTINLGTITLFGSVKIFEI